MNSTWNYFLMLTLFKHKPVTKAINLPTSQQITNPFIAKSMQNTVLPPGLYCPPPTAILHPCNRTTTTGRTCFLRRTSIRSCTCWPLQDNRGSGMHPVSSFFFSNNVKISYSILLKQKLFSSFCSFFPRDRWQWHPFNKKMLPFLFFGISCIQSIF